MMIELPKENMTNGKFRKDEKTLQFCVIPNTEENRDSIRHFNKLAKEQNSFFRLKMRYRCPKEGKHYGWGGDVACEDANGIGIYIQGATTNSDIQKYHSEIGKQDDEMDKVLLENLKLREEISILKSEMTRNQAIEHLESACGDYKNEIGGDEVYQEMCELVGTLH